MKIEFSPIDCKDNYLLLGIVNELSFPPRNCAENMEILAVARLEYLSRLQALQNEMRNKFEPQLVKVTDGNTLTKEEYYKIRDKIHDKYPLGDYWITNIFYT